MWVRGLLNNVPNIKELHFGPDAESTLTATLGWDTLWDAPNASQVSVWCGDTMIRPEPPPSPGFHYVDWVQNTPNVVSGWIDTGLTIDQDTSVSALVQGNTAGYMFFGTCGEDDQHDWRFFNSNTTVYYDVVN